MPESQYNVESVGDPEPILDSTEASNSKRRFPLWAVTLLVAAIVIALDQFTKYLAIEHLQDQGPVNVIGELVRFNLVRNPGAAFSLGTGYTIIFSFLAIAVAVVIVVTARKIGSVAWAIALGGILGGALGNLTDRIFREPGVFQGHVVDFIQLPYFAIFNVADISVTCSAVLIVILTIRGVPFGGSK